MDTTYRDDIKAMQAAGFSVQWGHWALTACRKVNGWPIDKPVRVSWPVSTRGPVDADIPIRNRVARELRTALGL